MFQDPSFLVKFMFHNSISGFTSMVVSPMGNARIDEQLTDVNTYCVQGTLKHRVGKLVASKEIGLKVNADKTKYMTMSRDQNAERSHKIKIHNISFERVEEFKYLGTTLTNQNSIQEEIESRLKSEKACYYSAQNL